MNQELIALLSAALECSFFLAPDDPGLSYDELQEIGRLAGYQPGEIGDAIRSAVGASMFGSQRWQPSPNVIQQWVFFFQEEPSLYNFEALDLIYTELNEAVRSVGKARAQIDRDVLIERGATKGISRRDMAAAILMLTTAQRVDEKNGALRYRHAGDVHQLPSQVQTNLQRALPRPARTKALPLVEGIIARRTDGRPQSPEPLKAFAEQLDKLGYGHFRIWWSQLVAEMQHGDPHLVPVTTTVLCAALVEGALTFIVRHAKAKSLATLASRTFDGDPRTWKIDDLVQSSANGRDDAILSDAERQQAVRLIGARQRIHAGRMLSEYPNGVPDLRPEEARAAKTTAELVVRRVMDWLEKFPPT